MSKPVIREDLFSILRGQDDELRQLRKTATRISALRAGRWTAGVATGGGQPAAGQAFNWVNQDSITDTELFTRVTYSSQSQGSIRVNWPGWYRITSNVLTSGTASARHDCLLVRDLAASGSETLESSLCMSTPDGWGRHKFSRLALLEANDKIRVSSAAQQHYTDPAWCALEITLET